tara:strand:- start:2579 stop:3118 length:540 start_codon:yes stop_codon:yes gene_type:complete
MPKQSFIQRLKTRLKTRFGPVRYNRQEFLASQQPKVPAPPIAKIKNAIAINETGIIPKGEKYKFRQSAGTKDPTNEALGKYQVTSEELATYAKRYLGRDITPDEFIKNPTAQEKYMDGKIKRFWDEDHTAEQVADIHRRGVKNSSEPGSDIYQDPEYVQKFQRNFYGTLQEAAARGFNR